MLCDTCGKVYSECRCPFGPTISSEEFQKILGNTKLDNIEKAIDIDWEENPPNPMSLKELADILVEVPNSDRMAMLIFMWLQDFYTESWKDENGNEVRTFDIPASILKNICLG